MVRARGLGLLFGLILLQCAQPAGAQPLRVELRSATGGRLGQLTGTVEGKVAYFALPEVARLVGGTLRTGAGGARVALTVRGRSLELRRDRARVTVDRGRVSLSAPVRLRQGTWLVPGDFLVTGLPLVLGSGIQVRSEVLDAGGGGSPPITPVSLPSQPAAVPRVAGAGPPQTEPTPGAVKLRHWSYPAYTRVVVEGLVGGEPRIVAGEGALTVMLSGAAGRVAPATRSIRDGLVGTIELGENQGEPTLRIALERSPARHRLLRLGDPPRLVLDLYRDVAGGAAAAAVDPAPRAAAPTAPRREEAAGRAPDADRPAPPAEPEPEAADAGAAPPIRAGSIELRYRSYPTYTRVVIEGAGPFEPRLIESRDGLVVPLAGLSGAVSSVTRTVRDGLVAALELGASRGQPALRVSFERAPAGRKVYRLQDPPRVVLDFYRTPSSSTVAPGERSALGVIVIDPGHGGHDPGAIGPAGLQEKELTLDIARRVAALVQEELGARVVLTRTRDQFLALRERTAFANRQRGDLFLSIHVNAAPGATATGTETYFLSSEATDNAARAAAASENKVIALEAGPRGNARDILRSILWDLAQSEFQQESSRLAEAVQDGLERALRQPSRGVKQAPFYVLGGAAMPAALVEIGFLSNPQEEARLRDDGHRDRIARALVAGLAAYKRHYDRKSGVVVKQ